MTYSGDSFEVGQYCLHPDTTPEFFNASIRAGWIDGFWSRRPDVKEFVERHKIPHRFDIWVIGNNVVERHPYEPIVSHRFVVEDMTKGILFKLWFVKGNIPKLYNYTPCEHRLIEPNIDGK